MPYILLIETATDVCSVAIATEQEVLACKEVFDCKNHAAHLTRLIEACCQETGLTLRDIDAVAVSSGPGSYTSLRVGVSVAKGLCFALDTPLIAVDTLAALAAGAFLKYSEDEKKNLLCLPMIDARREEVWLSVFEGFDNCLVPAQPLVLEDNSLEEWLTNLRVEWRGKRLVAAGNGVFKLKNGFFKNSMDICSVSLCSARYLHKVAMNLYALKAFENTAYFEPQYMKPPNITTANKKI